jgi:hypothetical protein
VTRYATGGGPAGGILTAPFFGNSVELDSFTWLHANISALMPGCFNNLQLLETLWV